jgi:hypothetical protein
MGWNSWDCYGASVTESELMDNAEAMAAALRPHGWEYLTVDIQWYEPAAESSRYRKFAPLAMDRHSRLIPAANRFPSSAGGAGFRPLAERLHAMGLKLGIHIMRGIPRQAVHADSPVLGSEAGARALAHPNSICPWNTDMYGLDPAHPGAQAYYDSLFSLYAEWGVDLVKVDDIAASRFYGAHREEMAMIRRARDRCGRPIVLSLSPGPAPLELASEFRENAEMWRITDDFWDRWEDLLAMFDRCALWHPHAGSGHWPDCDMLPLGRIGIRSTDGGAGDRTTRFSPDEQLAMLSLWCVFRSPLILGSHLPSLDDWTLSLLTNPEVIAVNQEGEDPRPLWRRGDILAWTSRAPKGGRYLALFNLGQAQAGTDIDPAEIDLPGARRVRDLWARADQGIPSGGLSLNVPSHGARLLLIGP